MPRRCSDSGWLFFAIRPCPRTHSSTPFFPTVVNPCVTPARKHGVYYPSLVPFAFTHNHASIEHASYRQFHTHLCANIRHMADNRLRAHSGALQTNWRAA